jgi:hypothetical protein
LPIALKAYLRFYPLRSIRSLHECRLVLAPVASEQPLLDLSDPQQQLEIVAQLGVHHLRAVGDRERHPWLTKAQMASRTVSSSGRAFVCEVGQIPNTLGPAGLSHQLLVFFTRRPPRLRGL